MQWGPPLRVVAPVFDMINHGGQGSANARFVVKDKRMFDLIVRGEEKTPVEVPFPCTDLFRRRRLRRRQRGG